MLAFVIGDFFRSRRRGPRYANDPLPMRPLLTFLWFWIFFSFGSFFGAVALTGWWLGDLRAEPRLTAGIVAMTIASPACFAMALRFLWKLTRATR